MSKLLGYGCGVAYRPGWKPGDPDPFGLGIDVPSTARTDQEREACGRKTYEGLALLVSLVSVVVVVPFAFGQGRKAARG